MKKVYLLFASVLVAFSSMGQTVLNAGMEAWHTSSAGGGGFPPGPIVPMEAPDQWYGFDSLIVEYGELFGAIAGFGNGWHQQIFKESTFVHAGGGAAKLITVQQDSVGLIAGVLASAKMDINISALTSGAGSPTDAVTFTGGTPTTLRPIQVLAWVAYTAGNDTATGLPGVDFAMMTVQAVGNNGGSDTVIGTGSVTIPPFTAYTQVAANLTYTTHLYDVEKVRIIFSSSGGGTGGPMDSSTLYVDDVEMVGEPQAVRGVTMGNDVVKVYPNPASGNLYVDGPVGAGYKCTLWSAIGQVVAAQPLNGHDKIDISKLATGLYLYTITDATGAPLQQGKVNVR